MYHLEMAKFMYLPTQLNFQIYTINILHPLKQYISTTQDALVTSSFLYMLGT